MSDEVSELAVGGLTLRGIAKGGVETCLMVPELGVMFDVGRCPPGALRYARVLASHGHADHLAGIHYHASQRQLMRQPAPIVHVPIEIEAPLKRIFAAWSEIEGFELPIDIRGVSPGDRFEVGKGLIATALRSVHRVPSLAYVVSRVTKRLDEPYRDLSEDEIRRLKLAGADLFVEHEAPLLCVTGDTRIELFRDESLLRRTKVLVHEVTSWDDRRGVDETRMWGHTHVDEMIEFAEAFEGDALVLVHRSMRHSLRDARDVVARRFPPHLRDKVHVFP